MDPFEAPATPSAAETELVRTSEGFSTGPSGGTSTPPPPLSQQLPSHSSQHMPPPPPTPLFFADAVLDLDEAHDIADTPEVPLRTISASSARVALDRNRLHEMAIPPLELLEQPDLSSTAPPAQSAQSSAATTAFPPSSSLDSTTSTIDNPRPQQHQTKTTFDRIVQPGGGALDRKRPKRPPRWPRDLPWAVAFVLLVPTTLLAAMFAPQSNSPTSAKAAAATRNAPLTHAPLATASLAAIVSATFVALALSRWLYARDGPGRHIVAHAITTLSPVAHVATTLLLSIVMVTLLQGSSRYAATIPLYFVARDVCLFQRHGGSSSNSTGGRGPTRHWETTAASSSRDQPTSMATSTTRQAFFQALVEASLDALAKSLRRAAVARTAAGVVITQALIVGLWRTALLAAIGGRHPTIPGSSSHYYYYWGWCAAVLVAGKWATGTCARLLTLIASGGVTGWCLDQSESLERLNNNNIATTTSRSNGAAASTSAGTGGAINGIAVDNNDDDDEELDRDRMPEAYRTVDASVYQSVLALDDDDEYGDDDNDNVLDEFDVGLRDEGESWAHGPGSGRRGGMMTAAGAASTDAAASQHHPRATARSLLWAGLTTSFGSVVLCGLVGGPAQYVWSQLRKVRAARELLQNRRRPQQSSVGGSRAAGFATMTIGSSDTNGSEAGSAHPDIRRLGFGQKLIRCCAGVARGFVRQCSDLAMCHVATYHKGYHRAARDVAALVEESGESLTSAFFLVQALHDGWASLHSSASFFRVSFRCLLCA